MALSSAWQRWFGRWMPSHIKEISGDRERPIQLAYVISVLTVFLAIIMVLDNNLNTLPPEFAEFTQLSIILTAILCAIALTGFGALMLGWYLIGRLIIMLYAIGLVAAMTKMMGMGTGADLIGAIGLVFAPALIFARSELIPMLCSVAVGTLTMILAQAHIHFYGPLFLLPPDELIIIRYSVMAVAVCIGFFVIFLHYSAEIAKTALLQEKERSEALLLNILPPSVAERLKAGESPIADSVPNAAVLFADIVGFTSLSSTRPPAEIVSLLDQIFSTFDSFAAKHGVEKIKTIGDGYLAVGGLVDPVNGHQTDPGKGKAKKRRRPKKPLQATAAMALDMMAYIETFRQEGHGDINLRIGLHCGPVVAGVIGQHKFAYDLWGDTVNLASRMESNSIPGRITMSAPMQQALGDRYLSEDRGLIAVKGKGQVQCFFLLGRTKAS